MSYLQNACKPEGLAGKLILSRMNKSHAELSAWGLSKIEIPQDARCLEVGCGGGANVQRLLDRAPRGIVKALDYSDVSVEKTKALNDIAIQQNRCVVLKGDVMNLLFATGWFNVVTAFETVHFWPDLVQGFQEIHRVLDEDGVFLICNETDGTGPNDEKWRKKIQGMTIYTPEQLEAALHEAGFARVECFRNENHWLSVVARN